MRRFPFYILIALTLAFTGAFAMSCGDLDSEEGASCDPEEEDPEGFTCTCEDDADVDTCTLTADEDNNANNNAENPTVIIDDAAFSPNNLSITTGSTVTWTNNDVDQRNIYSPSANLDINIEPGDSAVFVFNDAGSYTITDRINVTNLPNLTMTITVR